MKQKILLIFFCVCVLIPDHSFGQKMSRMKNFLRYEKISVMGSSGLSNYTGDLCSNFSCTWFRPSIGGGGIFRFTDHLSAKSELNYFRLFSKDIYEVRNLSFRSGNLEFFTSAMYEYFPYTRNFRRRKIVQPYAFIGIGLAWYNPRGKHEGRWYNLRPLKTEGVAYGSITPIIPYGFGVKIKGSKNWDVLVETGYRKTFTDYLDDVSSYTYMDASSFDNPVSAALSNKTSVAGWQGQRGNPRLNDGYFITSVKLRYTFHNRKRPKSHSEIIKMH